MIVYSNINILNSPGSDGETFVYILIPAEDIRQNQGQNQSKYLYRVNRSYAIIMIGNRSYN